MSMSSSIGPVVRRCVLVVGMVGLLCTLGMAQTVPFTSGAIPPCDTSIFTANVTGIGTLNPPGWTPWSYSLDQLVVNITSDHPQTLKVQLTSPQGTTLLLSAFNGAGGQNYTNTTFMYGGPPNITTGTAPFTGNWTAQGGGFNVFDYQFGDGVWTITVIDTACGSGGPGVGGSWTPGWFDGGSGGFSFGFTGPPPCWGGIPYGQAYVCPGGSVDILGYYVAANWYNYTITLGGNYVPDPSAVTLPGTYFIDAYDPWGGCMYWATFQVDAVPAPSLGADHSLQRCSTGAAVNLTTLFTTVGSPLWSFNGTPITATAASAATAAGVYQVIDQNPAGCSDTALVTLSVLPPPALGADASVSTCAGVPVDLTTLYNTSGLAANWSYLGNAFTTPTAATAPGVYTLYVASPAGCTDQADVTVSVSASPLGADQVLGLCGNATLDLTALFTTTGLSAQWTLLGSPVPDPSSVSSAGTYRVVATNGAGCADTAFVTVNAVAAPALGADATAAICAGDAADLSALFTTTGLSASWTLAGVAVADPTSVNATGVYTLIATNAAGCGDTSNVVVTLAGAPVLGADQAIATCAGMAVDLTTLYATGANTTAWTESGAAVADPSAVMSAGTYTLTATNAAGCSASAMVMVSVNAAPALGADVTASTCAGNAIDLTSLVNTTGGAAAWTLNGTAVADPTAVTTTGNYHVVVSNAAGCTDTAVVFVTMHPNPSLGADQWLQLCAWQTADLGALFAVSGLTPVFTLNDVPVVDPSAVSAPGTYVITVTDANGCTDEAVAQVTAADCRCEADFTMDAHCIQDPVHFTLVADSTIVQAHWEFGGAANASQQVDPLVWFARGADVLVTLDATLSCGVVRVQRTIALEDCAAACNLWIPSAFTPDNDGLNDTWSWQGACPPEEFSVTVHDRWGQEVFSSTDPKQVWDGSGKRGTVPPGVYAYRMSYRLPYQDRKEVAGTVTLMK